MPCLISVFIALLRARVAMPHGTSRLYNSVSVSTVYTSLVPRPSLAPVFDRLQYAKTEPEALLAQFLHTASDQKPEPGKAWERG